MIRKPNRSLLTAASGIISVRSAAKDSSARLLPLVLLVLGVALFNSAKWIMLSENSAVALGITYTSRFVGVAAYAVIAYLFRDHLPSMRATLRMIALFAGLYFLSMLLVAITETGELRYVIQYASAVLYGIASALFFLLYAHAFSAHGAKKSALLFAVAQLVTNSFMVLFGFLGATALLVTRLAFLVVGPVCLIVSIRMLMRDGRGLAYPLQYEAPAPAAGDSAGEEEPPERRVFPHNTRDWVVLIAAGFVFSTLFGIIAQVSSAPGTAFGLYDVGTGIVLVLIDFLLVVLMYYVGETYTFAMAILITFLMSATGLLFFPYSQDSGVLAGALVRGGFDCSTVLLWGLIARRAADGPQRTFFYFGLYRAIATVYIGRAIGSLLLTGIPAANLLASIPAVGLWVLGVFAVVTFFLTSHGAVSPSSAEAFQLVLPASEAVAPQDEFSARIDAFATRLALSDREKEVLTETLHGQSRAGVAQKLFLSPDTVKYHLSRIYQKAGVSSRQELVAMVEKEPIK